MADHPKQPGYEYKDTVNLDELCDYIWSKDSPFNRRFAEVTEFSATTGLCVSLNIVTAAYPNPVTGIPAIFCDGVAGACILENVISNTTSCGDIVVHTYIAKDPDPKTNVFPAAVVPACESGVIQATVQDFANEAEQYVDQGVKVVDDIIDETVNEAVELGDNIVDGAAELLN